MAHLALARKWRPKRFEEIVGQSFAVEAISNALTHNNLHHAYLFTGTRGVGKTTIARILAKCLNCETGVTATPCDTCQACLDINNGCFPDLFEIDAASRTKVEDTRDILDNVPYAPTVGRFKIYLIDEVHMLSGHSFNALLKTLEEPPEHVKFLLATTDPQKLPATVLSRCLQFHLAHLTIDEIDQQLKHILQQESITCEADATRLISQAANGSMRDALSLLDQAIAYGNGTVRSDNTRAMLGTIDHSLTLKLLNGLADSDANLLVETCAALAAHGVDFSSALNELLTQLHTLTLIQVIPNYSADPALSELATRITPENVQLYYQIGLIGQRDLAYAPSPQSGFEMTLLRMLSFTPSTLTATQRQAPPRAQARPQPNPVKAATTAPNDWQHIFAQLNLTGAARMLAEQCALIAQTDTTITLALNPKHKALLQDAMVKRITDALSKHFSRPVQLNIELTKPTHETPAESQTRQAEQHQQNAEKAIYNDDKVQQIIKAFDAKIIKESIKPVTTSDSGEDT